VIDGVTTPCASRRERSDGSVSRAELKRLKNGNADPHVIREAIAAAVANPALVPSIAVA
jgi:hypothetical protein